MGHGDFLYQLKVRKHLKPGSIPSMLHKFVAHKFAGGEKTVDAFPVSPHPLVNISFRHQHHARARARVAFQLQRMPKVAAFARFASFSVRHQVVAGA